MTRLQSPEHVDPQPAAEQAAHTQERPAQAAHELPRIRWTTHMNRPPRFPVRFTLLLAQGVSPRVVMETLGHSQVSLTLNTYSHVLPALQEEAAAKMDAILAKS